VKDGDGAYSRQKRGYAQVGVACLYIRPNKVCTSAVFFDPDLKEKENAAKQTLEQLHERRKHVVRLYKRGIKIMKVVKMTGLSYPAVRAVIDQVQVMATGRNRCGNSAENLLPGVVGDQHVN
jgi:hypothetical protein